MPEDDEVTARLLVPSDNDSGPRRRLSVDRRLQVHDSANATDRWPKSSMKKRDRTLSLSICAAVVLMATLVFWTRSSAIRPLRPVVPPGQHPIGVLMDQAEKTFKDLIAKQSGSFDQAVLEYNRRYRRRPPKGFDKWWEFAVNRSFVLIDEFDTIHRDLEPFWGLSAEQIEDRRKEFTAMSREKTLLSLEIRGGRINFADPPEGVEKIWDHHGDMRELFAAFIDQLPDMNVLINRSDFPFVFVSWEERQRLVELGRRGEVADDADEIGPDPIAVAAGKGFGFEDLRSACSPESEARSFELDALGGVSYPLGPMEDSFRLSPSQGGLIYNFSLASDPCHNVAVRNQNGNFLRPVCRPRCVRNRLYPIFSWSKYRAGSDITIPSKYRWQETPDDPLEWDKMKNKVFWRGSFTGRPGSNEAGRMFRTQRIRLIAWLQDVWDNVSILARNNDGQYEMAQMAVRKAAPRWTDIGLVGNEPWFTDKNLEEMHIKPAKGVSSDERSTFKLLLDIDGWGWSARFRSLLLSPGATMKTTVYHEIVSDWLVPWYHFIPVSYDYSDMFTIIAYFFGIQESGQKHHQDELKAIADRSREWAEKQLKWEHMEVYLYRLFLEWGRLTSVDRTTMDYVA
ncbi:hypothetical protein BD324DRAFT_615928 [Kockovaella imperatae]|uniref:Glycosyl transferase CAP10 domain-containing protein n=1 Tax=Kockovaella imperatae TaxID=4999 RepID=A0A1Y1UPS9_9TREE|nr:hypothetical protein BD324DRAFT_615928 [Kockovaella imperatae]ORX40009.1 hypothetical protein BD324DRAFT_615928 [Kockovaella imperatae]